MNKVKGLISESDYIEMSKDFTTERERLERVITDGEKQLAEIEEKIAAGNNRREMKMSTPVQSNLPVFSERRCRKRTIF